MEVKKAKQTYFIQGQLPQLLLRSAFFSILFLLCVVQLVTIGMLPSGFIRAQSVKAMY
jgi:hypothetical protein